MTSSRFIPGRMGKRTAAFSLVALLLGTPAVAARLLCVGGSCDAAAETDSYAPFCSLPSGVRASVTESTRDGRSGELLMVARRSGLSGGSAFGRKSRLDPQWPSVDGDVSEVPIVMAGAGIAPGGSLPAGAGLDDVAPTISEVLRFERTHPEVRSGESMSDVVAPSAQSPRMVVIVAWKGVGSRTLSAAGSLPNLEKLIARGSATLSGTNNSFSSDPAAPLTTLGTGGNPSEHGITGSLLRNERAELVGAWGPASPINVIATLGEDLDEAFEQEPVVALVGTQEIDRGLTGGGWYVDNDRDLVEMLPEASPPSVVTDEARRLLRSGALAKDEVPDLLGVALQGSVTQMDAELGRLWRAARAAAGDDLVLVLAGTGSAEPAGSNVDGSALLRRLERAVPGDRRVIEGVGPGEVFIDQDVLAERKISDDVILEALMDMQARSGDQLFADVFPSVTVTFGRYC